MVFSVPDVRNRYHHALAIHQYGQLQLKWDKRETQGQRDIDRATALLNDIPFVVKLSRGDQSIEENSGSATGNWIMPTGIVHLTQFVQYPL